MIDDRLKTHVYTLAQEIGERNVFKPRALFAAADYIEAQWTQQGYAVIRQSYEVETVPCKNLEITREGTAERDDILLIGAHYDSVLGSPGANDNGTGIAALLELSRRFAPLRPPCSVRFVAFVNEEPPFFTTGQMGSQLYARTARERGDPIRVMMCLETIGCYRNAAGSQQYPPLLRFFYPNTGNFIAFVSNFGSRRMMRKAVRAFRGHCNVPLQHLSGPSIIPGLAWSDHSSFWQERYRAFMVTDTAFYRYPYYHTAQDTPDKVDYAVFSAVTDGLFKTIRSLSGLN